MWIGESDSMAYILFTIGCTKYAQYVTLENGYRSGADRRLFTHPPWPVEQAMMTQAQDIAHAVWLSELYAAAASWVSVVLNKPNSKYNIMTTDAVHPEITTS